MFALVRVIKQSTNMKSDSLEKVTPLLEQLKANLDKDASLRTELEKTIKGVVVFIIDGERWRLDLRPGRGSLVHETAPQSAGNAAHKAVDESDKVDLTLTMKGGVFVALVSGKLGSQQAFLTRKLSIKGSMGLAMKLQPILEAVNRVTSSL